MNLFQKILTAKVANHDNPLFELPYTDDPMVAHYVVFLDADEISAQPGIFRMAPGECLCMRMIYGVQQAAALLDRKPEYWRTSTEG